MRNRCVLQKVCGLVLLTIVLPLSLCAQDDPNEVPLGDVARSMRKKTPAPTRPIIDDDNLPQVMEQVNRPHETRSGLRFLMSGQEQGFHVQAPDVTCSLSFSANVKTLLSGQFDQMNLPPSELAKVEAKAVIEGDALTVPVFNGTPWHLSELTVALTVVRKTSGGFGTIEGGADAFEQVRPEKKPDRTEIYRMRAAGAPWDRAVFSAPLDLELGPDEEWHWAIVQAKGYPPEIYSKLDAHISQETSTGTAAFTPQPFSFSATESDSQKANPQ
jgi:hypothetical protein